LAKTMSSEVNISTLLINLANGKANFTLIIPALVIAVAMIASTFLWPSLIGNYTKKNQKVRNLNFNKIIMYI